MANWLSAAANAFQRSPTVEPQTYELRCSCGRIVGGVRATTYQQITCPSCRQRLFVLPASVYPRPKAARPRPKPAPRPQPTAAVAQVIPEPGVPAAPSPRKPVLTAREKPRPFVTPVRIALVAVACASLVTIWGVNRSRSLQQAEVDFAEAVRLGREALKKKELAHAAEHFAVAAKAADRLGREDAAAKVARQLANETGSAVNLLEDSPSNALAEAVQTRSTSGDSAWREVFQYRYRDGWLILDAPVSLTTANGETATAIQFPVFTPDGAVEADLVLDAAFLRSLASAEGPRRIILAGQLEELKPDAANPSHWRFVLNPRTAFLWSNPDTYALVLGQQPLDGATRLTLAEQTRALNLSPWQPEAAE